MMNMAKSMGATLFGNQFGQALGEISAEVLSMSDVGIPLTDNAESALICHNIENLCEGLSVSVDDVAGGYIAASHLIEKGRKKLAFAGGPMAIQQVADRLQGAKNCVDEHDDVTLEVINCKSLSVVSGREIGLEILSRKESDRPTAIFAANDLLAIGILQACLSSGEIKIPRNLSLIGYDDIGFASTAIVALTSVRQPTHEMGARAFELLIQESEQTGTKRKTTRIEFQPQLVVREST
jgi:LacI family transcriptional regulator